MRYDQIDCFNHNSFNSSPFWMIYGFFLSENLCGSPVRAAQVWVQVQPAIPVGYPCHSLCSVLTWPCALPTVPGAQIPLLLAGTSITNNLRHFRLPQNKYQVPCLLLFICICSSWHAGTHKQGLLPKPWKSLWQYSLVKRISMFLTDRSSPDLSYTEAWLESDYPLVAAVLDLHRWWAIAKY